jgi:hypothetical protein
VFAKLGVSNRVALAAVVHHSNRVMSSPLAAGTIDRRQSDGPLPD